MRAQKEAISHGRNNDDDIVRAPTVQLGILQDRYFEKRIEPSSMILLSGGYSSATNYCLEVSGVRYFARFMSNMQPLESRKKECHITEYAGKLGVGPEVYYQDPQQGILLTEFVEGRTAGYNDLIHEPTRSLIIANVRKLHQATPAVFPKAKSLGEQIQAFMDHSLPEPLKAVELTTPLMRLLQCEENSRASVLIHNDFNPYNIMICDNRAYLIDWTDAGTGDPFSDISWHALCYPWSEHPAFLRYYFDEINTRLESKLCCYTCLRLFRLAIWSFYEATLLDGDCELMLPGFTGPQNPPEFHHLVRRLLEKELILESRPAFLDFSAMLLQNVLRMTKTDRFLSTIEELSCHE
jgi:thiamine kinase-like enzyme